MALRAGWMKRRARRFLSCTCCFMILACCGIASAETPSSRVAGAVKDALGNLIADVEILIVLEQGSMLPIARVTSDQEGHFRLPAMNVGAYRFAAIKDGYRTAVGSFNSSLQQWVDVVIRPMPGSDSILSRLPKDPDWILRVPRRSIFRELDPPRIEPAVSSQRTARSSIADGLSVQVRHLMAWNEPQSGDESQSGVGGTETLLRLASAVGERGRLSFVGSRDREGIDGIRADSPNDRSTEGVSVDFEYATSPETDLRFRAYYHAEDLTWTTAPGLAGIEPSAQADRSWGYGSEWKMQLDPLSRVDVRLDIQDRSIQNGSSGSVLPGALSVVAGLPGVATHPADIVGNPGSGVLDGAMSQRAVRASGSYRNAVAGHQLQVGLRAQHLESPLERYARSELSSLAVPDGIVGWSVILDAEDRWAVSGPFTLVYGLGYKHAVEPLETSLLVPRLGGRFAISPIALGFAVSYHAVSAWEVDPAVAYPSSPMQLDGRVGYSMDTELPLTRLISLRASSAYAPVQLDPQNSFWESSPWIERPLFQTDGNAEIQKSAIGIHRDSPQARTYAEFSSGSADGMVNVVRPNQDVYTWLTPSRLQFKEGKVGVALVPSGTDVRLEYSRVEEQDVAGIVGLGRVQDSLELRVIQDLLRFESLGRWRLLMAFRLDAIEDESRSDELDHDAVMLSAENRAVRAGLSVTF